MRTWLLIGAALMCARTGMANGDGGRLQFCEAGFSIAPLEAKPGDTPYQALMMFLPAKADFAANVNVQIQPFTGTIKDYAEISREQFKTMHWTLVRETPVGTNALIFEYTGSMQGAKLHWYAKAEYVGDKVYLVTATAPDAQWKEVSAKLIACVDSFKVEPGK